MKLINKLFNFIKYTRLSNLIKKDYRDYIITFILLSNKLFLLYKSVIFFITLSILIDTYPLRIYNKYLVSLYKDNYLYL